VELLIGVAMFGNEPDIFRYAKRDKGHNIVPLGLGYGLGMLIFPIAGYLMAELSNAATLGATMHFFTKFSLFGLTALAVIVFSINLFALNDANLYEAVNATQNFLRGKWRVQTVMALGVVGALVAIFMERSSSLQNNFFIVANICAVFLPCATIVMALDVFFLKKVSGCTRTIGVDGQVTSWRDASPGNIAGIVAIVSGLVVGAITGGLIPGTSGYEHTNVGTASAMYFLGMFIARMVSSDRTKQLILGLPNVEPLETPAAPDAALAL
jgi:hypothetical protein